MGEAVTDVKQQAMLPKLRPVPTSRPKRERSIVAGMPISVTAGSFKSRNLTVTGCGRRNSTVAYVRGFTQFDVAPKMPGRTYGPSPCSTVSGQGKRMSNRRRRAAYMNQNGRTGPLTAAQYRRIERTTTARIA